MVNDNSSPGSQSNSTSASLSDYLKLLIANNRPGFAYDNGQVGVTRSPAGDTNANYRQGPAQVGYDNQTGLSALLNLSPDVSASYNQNKNGESSSLGMLLNSGKLSGYYAQNKVPTWGLSYQMNPDTSLSYDRNNTPAGADPALSLLYKALFMSYSPKERALQFGYSNRF